MAYLSSNKPTGVARAYGIVTGAIDNDQTPSSEAGGVSPTSQSETTNLSSTQTNPSNGAPPALLQTTTPETSTIDLSGYKPSPEISGFYAENLLGPIAEEAGTQYEKLGETTKGFTEEAGPYNVWDTEEATLQEALKPGADLGPAQGLLASEYTGPYDLTGQPGYSDLAASIGNLYKLWGQGNLSKYGGARELVQQSFPGLTFGEYRAEAQRALRSPEYLQGAGSLREALGSLYGGLQYAGGQAEAIGAARTQQEADIAKQSGEWLRAKELEIKEPIAARVEEAQDKEKKAAEAFAKFEETGDWKELQNIPEEMLAFDPKEFNTPAQQHLAEGVKLFQHIMNKPQYAAIKDVPLLEQYFTDRGREGWKIDPEWQKENKSKYTDAEWRTMADSLWIRQHELAGAGFSQPWNKRGTRVTGSKYGDVLPLFYGDVWNPLSPLGYVGYNYEGGQQPMEPTVRGMATGEERRVIDVINQLLGIVEDSDWVNAQPYVASRIGADLERFLEDEATSLRQQEKKLTANERNFLEGLDDARKRFKKAKSKNRGLNMITFGGGQSLVQSPLTGSMGGEGLGELSFLNPTHETTLEGFGVEQSDFPSSKAQRAIKGV